MLKAVYTVLPERITEKDSYPGWGLSFHNVGDLSDTIPHGFVKYGHSRPIFSKKLHFGVLFLHSPS
jgi:hypothetical protein